MQEKRKKRKISKIYSVMVVPEFQKGVIQFRISGFFITLIIALLFSVLLVVSSYSIYAANRLKNAKNEKTLQEESTETVTVLPEQTEDTLTEAALTEEQLAQLANVQTLTKQNLQMLKELYEQENEIREKIGLERVESSQNAESDMEAYIAEQCGVKGGQGTIVQKLAYYTFAQEYIGLQITALQESSKLLHEEAEAKLPELDNLPNGYPIDGISNILHFYGNPKEDGSVYSGLDLGTSAGAKILATGAGVVIFSAEDEETGKTVKIDHGNGYITIYGYNAELLVQEGDTVKKGQEIAESSLIDEQSHMEYRITYQGKFINPETMLNIKG